jgi:hypothetical protein
MNMGGSWGDIHLYGYTAVEMLARAAHNPLFFSHDKMLGAGYSIRSSEQFAPVIAASPA